MPAASRKLIHGEIEATSTSGPKRIRLSKALAKIPKKSKASSNRFKFPDDEYAQLTALKQRLMTLGMDVKRGELLRAGLMLLRALGDAPLKKAVAKVESVNAGRPPKMPG